MSLNIKNMTGRTINEINNQSGQDVTKNESRSKCTCNFETAKQSESKYTLNDSYNIELPTNKIAKEQLSGFITRNRNEYITAETCLWLVVGGFVVGCILGWTLTLVIVCSPN